MRTLFVDSLPLFSRPNKNLSPSEILQFDIEELFEELKLFSHLSATRGNGLRAMVQRIRAEARTHQSAEE